VKTGFRAKDAKNAKKLLQGEPVEFVYESFREIFAFFASLARVHSAVQKFQHQTGSYRYAKFNGSFVLVAEFGARRVRPKQSGVLI
jgi:hypothetical protein